MELKVEFLTAKNNESTMKINDYYIHSKYNPSKEAIQIAEKNYLPHNNHFIFGYGCGHLINSLKTIRQHNEQLIIIDPLFDVKIMEKPSNEDNIYYFGVDELKDFELYLGKILGLYDINNTVICLTNYDKLFLEEYKLLLTKIKEEQYRNIVNRVTTNRHAREWYKNFLYNLNYLEKDNSGKILKKAYNKPIVVVSGGPSLKKQLPILKEFREKLIVICAGSTINTLLNEGIEPNYIVTIHSGDANRYHFQNLSFENAKIVYCMQNHPEIRKSFKHSGYVIQLSGLEKQEKFIKEKLNVDLPSFPSGSSVAHAAYNFANYITSGPVCLIGQDLAFTNEMTHSNGNKLSQQVNESFIKKNNAFQVVDYYGNKVWTNIAFDSMRLAFEDLLKIMPKENLVFNCTEGGAKINGMDQLPFNEFCLQFAQGKDVKVISNQTPTVNFDFTNFINEELIGYEELIGLLNSGLAYLANNTGEIRFDPITLKKLQKTERKVLNIIEKLTVEPLVTPILIKLKENYLPTKDETEVEAFNRVYIQTRDFYQDLLEEIHFAKKTVLELMTEREVR